MQTQRVHLAGQNHSLLYCWMHWEACLHLMMLPRLRLRLTGRRRLVPPSDRSLGSPPVPMDQTPRPSRHQLLLLRLLQEQAEAGSQSGREQPRRNHRRRSP